VPTRIAVAGGWHGAKHTHQRLAGWRAGRRALLSDVWRIHRRDCRPRREARRGGRAAVADARSLAPLLAGRGSAARLALGFVWGLVPCALVYSVLPIAMFAGGAWQGAAIMLAFGVGTLPNVVAAGMLMDRAKAVRGRVISRYAVAGIIAAFALVGAYRALWVPGALVQGPFCLVP